MLAINRPFIICLIILLLSILLWNAPGETKLPIVPAIHQEMTDETLSTKGEFPLWLHGVLVRNSSIPLYIDGKQISHPFDGLAMLHGFDFYQGKVKYTNRFIVSNDYKQAIEKGNPHYGGFGTPRTLSFLERIKNYVFPQQELENASVNVFKYGNRYVALTETPLPVCFDLKTLKTLGSFQFNDTLPISRSFESAHPHLDPSSSEVYNYLIEFGPQSYYVLYRLRDSTRKVIAKIAVDMPSYMHSFAITQNYLILVEFPLVINPQDLMQGKTFMQSMSWKPERKCRFLVIDKKTGKTKTEAKADPFFSFHHANAYESDEGIILDMVTYPDVSMMKAIFAEGSGPSHEHQIIFDGKLKRYHLSLKDQHITSKALFDKNVEFPRLDDRLDGKSYTFLYLTLKNDSGGGLVKVNVQSGEVKMWQQPGCEAVEPIFVPAPQATSEDDGLILTVVFDPKQNHSYLLALDGKTFQEIARAPLPFHIPDTFHGQFFSDPLFIQK